MWFSLLVADCSPLPPRILLRPCVNVCIHFILPYNGQTTDVHRRLSTSLVVGDLPLTTHRDSFRPTDKSECMVRRSSASGARVLRAHPSPEQRHNTMNFHGNRHTPWFESPHISCAVSLQPESPATYIYNNAHPYTAVCARRCRLTTRRVNLKLIAPCHASCIGRCTRFGDDQRARNDNWQRMCAPMLVGQRTTQCRSARTIAGYIHHPNRTTSVRATRAYCRISLRNLRTHCFAQLRQHLTGTSSSRCTRAASSWLNTMPRKSARQCHNCSVVL